MVKVDTSEVKKGMILLIEGKFGKVVEMGHTHTGRGGATYNFKLKDLKSGANTPLTVKAGTALEQAEVQTKSAIYLYKGADTYSFMEGDTGEIHEIEETKIDDIVDYLKENLDVFLTIYQGNVLTVLLPSTITYTIAETVPGLKGDRSSAGKKPATLDNGLEVQVPLHKEAGQTVVVNTLTGEAN